MLTDAGSAHLFEREESGLWVQVAKFVASDSTKFDYFGESVALSGDRALIGTSFNDNDAGVNSGSSYLYDIPAVRDQDQDGVVDANDNCPSEMNPLQENFDADLQGDVCDRDDDNDGIDDTADPFPLNPNRPGGGGLPPLTLNTVESRHYGFLFEGINSHREILERSFDASGEDLILTLTGYDIDTRQEVRALVNGTPIGSLSRTPDNGRSTSELTIAQSLLRSEGNTLRFEQLNPGWRWGVTDLLLSEADSTGDLPTLVPGSVDSGIYGFRFEGVNNHRDILERRFDASGSDLTLTLTGFDIDNRTEVRVLVNGTPIGFLSRTPNNRRGLSELTIVRSLLNSKGNTLRIEQLNSGWIWGVTDLLLSESGK